MVLVGLLAPVGVVASWNAIKERRKIFYSLFLVQQTAMFGVFVSLDLMLYYGFWELSLVPMAILIAMYGRKDGPKAAIKFFLFTFIPSAPLLVAILWLYARTGTFNFSDLQMTHRQRSLPAGPLFWVALAFLFAFAVKVPVFPLHGWLADTFSEAPVAMAMVVAGKLGLYSMLRFHVGLFPAQARAIAPLLIALAVIGILYGACLALVQRDFWRLLAFALLSHLSLITLGIYGLTFTGWDGAIYQILNNGVVDAALFLLLALAGDSLRHKPDCLLRRTGGKIPQTATLFVITSLAMIGLPMLNGFVGEFLILSSTFTGVSRGWAIAATLGVILGAAYMLWLVQRLFYGPESELAASTPPTDLRAGELAVLWPLAVLMLVMGVAPSVWIPTIENRIGTPAVQGSNVLPESGQACRWSGRGANESCSDILRILPEMVLTLTGVLMMLIDASLPPDGTAVGSVGSLRLEPPSPYGQVCGNSPCRLERVSMRPLRPAPSPSSFTCSSAASCWLRSCWRWIPSLRTAITKASTMR